jgi:hypothetical protein
LSGDADDGKTSPASIALRLSETLDRVKRYLAAVDASRLRYVAEVLDAYGLGDDTLYRNLQFMVDAEAAIRDRETSMMRDLVRYYRVPEGTAEAAASAQRRDELTRNWAKAFDTDMPPPHSTIAALGRDPSVHPTELHDARTSHDVPSPQAAYAKHGANAELARFVRDQAQYATTSIRPEGFRRQDAVCSTCGVETLNPAELHKHMRLRHPTPDDAIVPPSQAKTYEAARYGYTRRVA